LKITKGLEIDDGNTSATRKICCAAVSTLSHAHFGLAREKSSAIPVIDEKADGLLHRSVFIRRIIHDYLTRAAGKLAHLSVKQTPSKIN